MTFPMIVEFYVDGSDDAWLRARIRGEDFPPPRLQRVVVEAGTAEKLVYRMAAVKHARQLPYGGATMYRAVRETDGSYRKFVEGVDR